MDTVTSTPQAPREHVLQVALKPGVGLAAELLCVNHRGQACAEQQALLQDQVAALRTYRGQNTVLSETSISVTSDPGSELRWGRPAAVNMAAGSRELVTEMVKLLETLLSMETVAEIVARAIDAGRRSSPMQKEPRPLDFYAPEDLRDGTRAARAIIALIEKGR